MSSFPALLSSNVNGTSWYRVKQNMLRFAVHWFVHLVIVFCIVVFISFISQISGLAGNQPVPRPFVYFFTPRPTKTAESASVLVLWYTCILKHSFAIEFPFHIFCGKTNNNTYIYICLIISSFGLYLKTFFLLRTG